MNTYNILTIDGGGLRGIVPVRILQKIEIVTGKKIHELFDMIAGTSTGGLIAAFLTLPDENNPTQPKFGLDTLDKIYTDQGSTIFPPAGNKLSQWLRDIKSYFRPEFSDHGLNQVLSQYVSQGANAPCLSDAILPILVSTYNLRTNTPIFFKSSEAKGDPTANAKIFDVCRATSAAPTYLPAYTFTYKQQLATCIDGGVYANNPTMAAIAEIKKYGTAGFYKKRDGSSVENLQEVNVLSLGTGNYTGDITEQQAERWGALAWVTHIVDVMMKGVNQSTDYEAKEIMDLQHYLRVNINILDKKYIDMADSSQETLHYLEDQVKKQVTDNSAIMQQLKNLLT